MFKSWKTTLFGLCAALGQILPALGVPVDVANAFSVVALFLLGLFAKDSNVTGGTVQK